MSSQPRGIRNHNPGNIDRDGTPWQGMAADQSSDPRFVVFASAEWGIRALARLLITYQDKHRLRTVRGIVARYAPPGENDTGAYANAVASAIGVGPDALIDVHQYSTMEPLVQAIIRHENGDPSKYGRGGRWYPQSVIDEGLRRTGILPQPATAAARAATSPEVIGTSTASGGGAVALVADQLQQTAAQVQAVNSGPSPSTILSIIAVVMIVVGIGITLYGIVRRNRGAGA